MQVRFTLKPTKKDKPGQSDNLAQIGCTTTKSSTIINEVKLDETTLRAKKVSKVANLKKRSL